MLITALVTCVDDGDVTGAGAAVVVDVVGFETQVVEELRFKTDADGGQTF